MWPVLRCNNLCQHRLAAQAIHTQSQPQQFSLIADTQHKWRKQFFFFLVLAKFCDVVVVALYVCYFVQFPVAIIGSPFSYCFHFLFQFQFQSAIRFLSKARYTRISVSLYLYVCIFVSIFVSPISAGWATVINIFKLHENYNRLKRFALIQLYMYNFPIT